MTTEMRTKSLLSPSTQRAIKKYGRDGCLRAFTLNTEGEGPSTIAHYLGLSGVRAANAAIDAGREIANFAATVIDREKPSRFLYEIELQSWHPSQADRAVTDAEIVGGANDLTVAWEFARTVLRMTPNTERAHRRVQVWRMQRRGIEGKLMHEMTRAEWDAKHAQPAN